MSEFRFVHDPLTKKWIILDPNRSRRPNIGHGAVRVCPFCYGKEADEDELYRVGGETGDTNWRVRVIRNAFPFAPIHELVLHSPDHHKNFEELPLAHVELIIKIYKARYVLHKDAGQVYIFHNRGIAAGESIPHPHTQIAVVPRVVHLDLPPLDTGFYSKGFFGKRKRKEEVVETTHFHIFCPAISRWPDEIWIAPVQGGRHFGDATDAELSDLAFCLQRLIAIFDSRYGHEFPFNFYIYPGRNWYLRIMPRMKTLGGFEVGTGIMVNTQDPKATFAFLQEHFFEPDLEKIEKQQQAEYWKSV